MPFKKQDANELLAENLTTAEGLLHSRLFDAQYNLIADLVSRRKMLGYTQLDVANRSGLAQQAVSRLEQMGHSPKLDTLLRYVVAIDSAIVLDEQLLPQPTQPKATKTSEVFWTTQEGEAIPLSEMSEAHIKNASAMLRRNLARQTQAVDTWTAMFHDELARRRS